MSSVKSKAPGARVTFLTLILASAVAVAVALAVNGSGSTSSASVDYAAEKMRQRSDAGVRLVTYDRLWQVAPNVSLQPAGSNEAYAGSERVVRGTFADVTAGKAFFPDRDNEARSVPAEFTDPRAEWKTIHTTVVETSTGAEVPVGIAVGKDVDLEPFARSLKAMGEVVLFLDQGSPVFSYDPERYRIVEDGGLVAQVNDNGTLSLPFIERDRAAELLRDTKTVDELEERLARPQQVIERPQNFT